MSTHLPPIPVGNRSKKGPASADAAPKDSTAPKYSGEPNTSEQGDTANIKQNTTNKGFFHGRRMK
jgi:hypothetical protein